MGDIYTELESKMEKVLEKNKMQIKELKKTEEQLAGVIKEHTKRLKTLMNQVSRFEFLVKNEHLFNTIIGDNQFSHYDEREDQNYFSSRQLGGYLISHMPKELSVHDQFTYAFMEFFYHTKYVIFCSSEDDVSWMSGYMKSVADFLGRLFGFYLEKHEATIHDIKEFLFSIFYEVIANHDSHKAYEQQLEQNRIQNNRMDARLDAYRGLVKRFNDLFYFPLTPENMLNAIDFDQFGFQKADFTIEHIPAQKMYQLRHEKYNICIRGVSAKFLEYELQNWKQQLYMNFYGFRKPDEIFNDPKDEQEWYNKRKIFEEVFAEYLPTEEYNDE